jgi:hypothetical protein
MRDLSGKFRSILMAAGVAALGMGNAEAQIIPGDTPSTGIGAAVSNSRSRSLLGLSKGGANSEYVYQSRPASGSPNRKPAGDPWAGVRQTTPAPSYDRHRAY